MVYLVAGLVIFFGTHLFSALRPRTAGADLKERMGAGPYMALYSVVSLVGLVLIIYGVIESRAEIQADQILYVAPAWGRHLNYALMLLAMIALAAAYVPVGYIKKALKHPMLVAIKVWALGHLLANGELYSVLLFGSFLVFAVVDRIALKRRGDTGLPADVAVNPMGDLLAIAIGSAVYAVILFWLHGMIFGAAVWPIT